MLLSEMISRLRIALSDEDQPYKYSTARIRLWLQGAYMDRQLASSYWKFMHQSGPFIVTEAGIADYSLALVKSINPDSLYYIKSGTSAHIPLCLKDYAEWVEEETSRSDLAPSPPSYLIEMPDFTWKIYPVPDSVYTIYADRWYRPAEFASDAAEPLWESEFHEIVILDAMKIAIALHPDSPDSNVMVQQIKERLPRLERTFASRYLPSISSPGAHL